MKKIILSMMMIFAMIFTSQSQELFFENSNESGDTYIKIYKITESDYVLNIKNPEVEEARSTINKYFFSEILADLYSKNWLTLKEYTDLLKRHQKEKGTKRRSADAIMGGFSDSNGKADGGEGDDNQAGDKGKVTGDPNASGYYGIGGDGSGGNYKLGNRKALNRPKPTYDCNEEGKVVVSISVDQSGRVIDAQAGTTGSTNSAPCLLKEAKEAALKTKFNADSNAPSKQVGEIIYNFSLSD